MKQFSFLYMVIFVLFLSPRPAPAQSETSSESRAKRTTSPPFFHFIDVYTGVSFTFLGDILFAEDPFTTYAETNDTSAKHNDSSIKNNALSVDSNALSTDSNALSVTGNGPSSKLKSISLEPVVSAKIVFNRLTLFGAAKMKDTSFADMEKFVIATKETTPQTTTSIPQQISRFAQEQLTYTYGARLHVGSNKTLYTADILAGTLRFSQAVSRLKTPTLSSGSALRRPGSLEGGFSPELPTRSSSGSGPALSVSITPSLRTVASVSEQSSANDNIDSADKISSSPSATLARQIPLPSVDAAYTSKEEWFVSVYTTFSGMKQAPIPLASASVCVTGGMFRYDGEGSTSWFAKEARFPEAHYPAGEVNCSLTFPFFRTSNAFGLHESPFGGGRWWFRTQDALLFGPVYLGATFFFGDSELYTADGTLLKTRMQASLNPQYTFVVHERPLRIGLLGATDFRTGTTGDEETGSNTAFLESFFSSLIPSYKMRFDANYRLQKTTLSAHTGFSYAADDENATISAGAGASHSFEKVNTSFSTSGQWCGKKATYTANASFYGKKNSFFSANAACSFSTKAENSTEKGTSNSGSASLGLTFRGSAKFLKWTGKTVFLFTF